MTFTSPDVSAHAPRPVRFQAAVPQFAVADVVRTAQYYRDVFGFQIMGYWDGERVSLETSPPPAFAIVERDGIEVFFSRDEGSSRRPGQAAGAQGAYLRVSGLNALADDLRARGADIVDGPELRSYGQRELVVRDCNGLILTFGENGQAGTAADLVLGWPVWLGIVCEDLQAQRRFYRDTLGLAELKAGADWVWFELDGKLLELLAKGPQPQYDRRRVSFAFAVKDIRSARDQLIKRGVQPVTEIEGGPESLQYWAYFKDAEGNLFELVQRLASSGPLECGGS